MVENVGGDGGVHCHMQEGLHVCTTHTHTHTHTHAHTHTCTHRRSRYCCSRTNACDVFNISS